MNITLDAIVDNLPAVLSFVDEALEEQACPMRIQMEVDVAVEELFVNVAHYAYGDQVGQVSIDLNFEDDSKTVMIRFSDSGMPYNPLDRDDPDITLPAEKREVGGLGIYMVKKSMDDFTYEYSGGMNHTTIRKRLRKA